MESSREPMTGHGATGTDGAPSAPTDRIEQLVARLQQEPEDRAALDELLATAEGWVEADGLSEPEEGERTIRPRLGGWLAHLCRGGSVLHYGWREGAVAGTLASTGARVSSHLDHPGRAMAAAIRHGSPTLCFGTLTQAEQQLPERADLVVVETAGNEPVVSFEHAAKSVRAGGWLAVLGVPLPVDVAGMTDAGCFCVDGGSVRPSTPGAGEAELALYRFSSPSSNKSLPRPKRPASRKPSAQALCDLILKRRDEPAAAVAVRGVAGRVKSLPIPDQELIDWVGGGTAETFHNIGLTNFHQLALYCGLRPDQRILEPGCGCGRNARAIAPFLDPVRGTYDGFDISARPIEWATARITTDFPNTRFRLADIQNSTYNPNGAQSSAEYVFPYRDAAFDVVFMPSVFTHMTRDGLEQYTREIARVLAPGGLLLSWHFLLDEVSRDEIAAGRSSIELHDHDAVSRVMLRDNPCAAIAFDESWVLEFYESVGLEPQAVIHGRWSGREPEGYHDYQDRILARKR